MTKVEDTHQVLISKLTDFDVDPDSQQQIGHSKDQSKQ